MSTVDMGIPLFTGNLPTTSLWSATLLTKGINQKGYTTMSFWVYIQLESINKSHWFILNGDIKIERRDMKQGQSIRSVL